MVADKFEELLDVGGRALVELGVVDVDHDLLKVVLLLLPLQFCLRLCTFILGEIFVEYAHREMFEVVLLNEELD